MKTKVFLMVFILSAFSLNAQDKAADILNRMYKNLASHKSMSYDITYKFKSGNKDTVFYNEHVKLMRAANDSIYHGYIWKSYSDTEYCFYDLVNSYDVKIKNRLVLKRYPYNYKSYIGILDDHLGSDFLNANGKVIKKQIRGTVLKVMNDTIIDGKSCWHVLKSDESGNSLITMQEHIFIRKKDYTEVLSYSYNVFMGWPSFVYSKSKNLVFDHENKNDFNLSQIPSNYTFQDDNPEERKPVIDSVSYKIMQDHFNSYLKSLHRSDSGKAAPVLNGELIQKHFEKYAINFIGKVTVLDFWFISCLPCIKAMPVVDSLQAVYGSKGVQFYGINSIDHDKRSIKEFPLFLKKHHIDYPLLLGDTLCANEYHIDGYPTFIVIDKKGIIRYTSNYIQNPQKVSNLLDELLKEN